MNSKRNKHYWIIFTGIMALFGCRTIGAEMQTGSANLISNPSFERPAEGKEEQALHWDNYQCGYTRTREQSYDSDVSGRWSCKITGTGGESDKGLGGANTFIRSGLPERGTFEAKNNIYIVPGTKGKILSTYVTVHYTDNTSTIIQNHLKPEQISENYGKWKTYSRVFSTDPDKKIDYIIYWCIVWSTDEGKFTGTVYFDNTELILLDKRTNANMPLPFSSVNRAKTPPVIDGREDDECWQKSLEISPFLRIGWNDPVSQQTRAYFAYDRENLYIFIKCFDNVLDPVMQLLSEFKAQHTGHDSDVWKDDCVEIFIRPQDKEFYYHLAVNSLGTVYDAKVTDGVHDKSWNAHAEAGAQVTEQYWTVEIAIPFRTLKTAVPETGDVWILNLARSQQAFHEFSSWAPLTGRKGYHEPERFGQVEFAVNDCGSRLLSIGELQKGENLLHLSVFNGGGDVQPFLVNILTRGTDLEPSVEKANFLIEPGKEKMLRIPYTAGDGSKSISYHLWQGHELLYASPEIPIQKVTAVFMVKSPAGKGWDIKRLTDFYMVEGELLYLPLVLTANTGKDTIEECRAVLEVPYFLHLISPLNRTAAFTHTAASPTSFTEKELTRDGIRYRQYTLHFKPDSLTFPEDAFKRNFTINKLFFKSEFLKTSAESVRKYRIYYQIFLDNLKTVSGDAELTVLSPFTQKRPKKTVICNWPCWVTFYRQFYPLGKEEQSEIVNYWSRAGFNVSLRNPATAELIKNTPMILNGELWPSLEWMSRQTPAIGNYLSEHPEDRTVTRDGQVLADVVSPAAVLKPDSPVWDMILKHLGGGRNITQMAREHNRLMYDYEVPVDSPASIGFDPANMELFREFAGIPKNERLTPDTLVENYHLKWIDFRCRQNAELIRLLNKTIKEVNPECIFAVYSGYQNSFTRQTYGINWQYVSPYVDEIWCGYGRPPVEQIKDTVAVAGGKPVIGGELAWLASNYNLNLTEINLFRRLTDCGGGIMVFYDWSCFDGRFYKAVSQVASVAADFERFFQNFDRDDSLAEVLEGGEENVAVLKNGQERLVFLFNNSSVPKIFKVKHMKLSRGTAGTDYWKKEQVNIIPFLETTVPVYSVTIIHLRDENRFVDADDMPS